MTKDVTIQKFYVGPKRASDAVLYTRSNAIGLDIKMSCIAFQPHGVVLRYYSRIAMTYQELPILHDNFAGLCIKIT